jgi:hypothetical protein
MKIQLVSFPVYSRLTNEKRHQRIDAISKVLNESSADFVMFSQRVLKDTDDLRVIRALVKNKSITAFVELKEEKGLKGNCMYIFQNGQWMYMGCQLLSESSDATRDAIEYLLDDFRGNHFNMRRQFVVGGKRFLVINCGENNILKGATGIAEFRLKDICHKDRFEEVLDSVDIILNPVHTKWGYFEKFLARIRKFSEHDRYCFSNTQIEGNQLENAVKNPDHNTTHVAMHNSEPLAPISTEVVDAGEEKVLVQTFEVL